MLYRKTDAHGDMLPVISRSDLHQDKQAVLDAVNSRLRLLYGEWWEDESLGFRIPAFLFDGTRMPAGPQILVNYISSYIAQTDGVRSVTDVAYRMENRKLVYSCTIVTVYGDAERSVGADVLLPAIFG